MSVNILYIIGVLLISSACGFVFIPAILRYCREKHLYDIPDSRKIHHDAIPRLGGIAFLPSMLISFAVAVSVIEPVYNKITLSLWSVYFLIALLLIYGMGIIDDLTGLPPSVKFAVQVIAACALPLSGLYLNNFYGLFGIYEIPFWVGAPLTVFTIVFIDNALNLIDGIDGLAASLSLLALSCFCYMFCIQRMPAYGILTAGLAGVLIPFLYFNLSGNKTHSRKIFMGDSGSLTLGFILGFFCVKFSMRNPGVIMSSATDVFMAYTLLIVPMFDVVRVFMVRLWHGRSPFLADKSHIHHKLMAAGLSQRKTLAAVLATELFYIILNYILLKNISSTAVLLTDVALYICLHKALNIIIRRRSVLG